jgi:hypothetical protein
MYGDTRYHTLHVLKDAEPDKDTVALEQSKQQEQDYWMPVL